jgi:hypothetical protein
MSKRDEDKCISIKKEEKVAAGKLNNKPACVVLIVMP